VVSSGETQWDAVARHDEARPRMRRRTAGTTSRVRRARQEGKEGVGEEVELGRQGS
jgi:hypothetical protein